MGNVGNILLMAFLFTFSHGLILLLLMVAVQWMPFCQDCRQKGKHIIRGASKTLLYAFLETYGWSLVVVGSKEENEVLAGMGMLVAVMMPVWEVLSSMIRELRLFLLHRKEMQEDINEKKEVQDEKEESKQDISDGLRTVFLHVPMDE